MKERLKLIFMILAFIGFMLLVGSVGSSELGDISNGQFLRRALISFGIFIFSAIGYKAVGWGEDEMY